DQPRGRQARQIGEKIEPRFADSSPIGRLNLKRQFRRRIAMPIILPEKLASASVPWSAGIEVLREPPAKWPALQVEADLTPDRSKTNASSNASSLNQRCEHALELLLTHRGNPARGSRADPGGRS